MNILNQETTEIENKKTLIKEIEREISEKQGQINLLNAEFKLLKKTYKETIKLNQQKKKILDNELDKLYKTHTKIAYLLDVL